MAYISVIVPVYKVEDYLCECIDSILRQSFSDFELILVDDGSPDRCGSICDTYAQKDKRIKVIHKQNAGVSAARNTALQIVAGEYVTFCDSDDYYQADWLEKLVGAAKCNHADMVIGSFLRVSDTGEALRERKHEVGEYLLDHPHKKIEYIINKIFGHKHGWELWTRLFRTEIIRNNHIQICETCGNFAEDLGFVLEYLLYADRVTCIDAMGYCYRVRSGSMMDTSKNIARLDSVNEVGLYFWEAAKKGLPKADQRILPVIFFMIMYNQYSKIVESDRYSSMKEEIKTIRRYKEWRKNTKKVLRSKKIMRAYIGAANTEAILLLTHYCLHGNWKRFLWEKRISRRLHWIRMIWKVKVCG